MLLSKKTIKEFGYNPRDLSKGSGKRIWVKCPICKTEKIIRKSYYHNNWVCINCSRSRRRIDLIGKRFGRLVVLNYGEPKVTKDGKFRHCWLCGCDCGNKINVRHTTLVSGNVNSCGCLHEEYILSVRKPLKIGSRIGKLIILKEISTEKGLVYECCCDCGKIINVRGADLRSGLYKSCGCWKSERLIKHGLSKTKEYSAYHSKIRRELKELYDSKWTLEMEQFLRFLQTECVICGSIESLGVDHVKALSKKNKLIPGNAVILCRSCNCRKNNKDLSELSPDIAEKISVAALQFKSYWEFNTLFSEVK